MITLTKKINTDHEKKWLNKGYFICFAHFSLHEVHIIMIPIQLNNHAFELRRPNLRISTFKWNVFLC